MVNSGAGLGSLIVVNLYRFEAAGNQSDQNMEDHSRSSGWKHDEIL